MRRSCESSQGPTVGLARSEDRKRKRERERQVVPSKPDNIMSGAHKDEGAVPLVTSAVLKQYICNSIFNEEMSRHLGSCHSI